MSLDFIAHFTFLQWNFHQINFLTEVFLNADSKEMEAKANQKLTYITLRKRLLFSINKKQLNYFNSLKKYAGLWVRHWLLVPNYKCHFFSTSLEDIILK